MCLILAMAVDGTPKGKSIRRHALFGLVVERDVQQVARDALEVSGGPVRHRRLKTFSAGGCTLPRKTPAGGDCGELWLPQYREGRPFDSSLPARASDC